MITVNYKVQNISVYLDFSKSVTKYPSPGIHPLLEFGLDGFLELNCIKTLQ